MSAINSVGTSTPIPSQPIQTAPSKPQPKAAATPSQPIKAAGSDPDHDGDSDSGGIDLEG